MRVMEDKEKTLRDILKQIPDPKVKPPTKLCLSYNPDSTGKCSFFRRGRCDAIYHSKASIEKLGEDYFCPHMPKFHLEKKKSLIAKEISKKYWTEYWENKLKQSEEKTDKKD